MNDRDDRTPGGIDSDPSAPADNDIPELVGRVYEAASARERVSLIEHLMSPLSLMAAFAVSNGIFARLWFQRGFHDHRIRIEDTDIVGKADIAALTSFVQQVSTDTIAGIASIVADSPGLAATAAAALLVATLGRKLYSGRGEPRSDDAD
jgi:hypothetical protein